MARTFDEISEDRSSRLDKVIPKQKELYFFDVNKAGILAPKTQNANGESDLGVLTNEQAIMESVYNILLTQPGERVMNPLFGCDLNQYLFEPLDSVTALDIVEDVYGAIVKFEPRVNDIKVIVTPNENQNTYIIDIYLTINTAKDPVKLTTTLEKVR